MALYNILKVDVPLLFSVKVWGSFVQTNLAFFAAGNKVFGKCWHQHFWVPPACRSDTSRHFLIARSAAWGGAGFFSEGTSFPRWAKRLSSTKAALCFSLVGVAGK